jgi:hypothetical protein
MEGEKGGDDGHALGGGHKVPHMQRTRSQSEREVDDVARRLVEAEEKAYYFRLKAKELVKEKERMLEEIADLAEEVCDCVRAIRRGGDLTRSQRRAPCFCMEECVPVHSAPPLSHSDQLLRNLGTL